MTMRLGTITMLRQLQRHTKTTKEENVHDSFTHMVGCVRKRCWTGDKSARPTLTSLHCNIHTGNAGAVILLKRAGVGEEQVVGSNGKEGSFSFKMCGGGEFATEGRGCCRPSGQPREQLAMREEHAEPQQKEA